MAENELMAACEAGATLVAAGLTMSTGGNLSVRLPDGLIAVTGTGTSLDRLTPEDFSVLDSDGTLVSGPRPSSEWRMHHLTYAAVPATGAVFHAHPHYAVLLDALGHRVRTFTLDHAFYLPRIARIGFHPNGSDELAEATASALADSECVIMGHHGIACRGGDVREALRRSLYLEKAAQATYEALLIGDTTSGFPDEHRPGLRHA